MASALRSLWLFKSYILFGLVSAVGTWKLLPSALQRTTKTRLLPPFLATMTTVFNPELTCVRGLAMLGKQYFIDYYHFRETKIQRLLSNYPGSALVYEYPPLQSNRHIRLLSVESGAPGSTLTCTVNQVSLDDAPVFEALSYTWGPKLPSMPLRINNQQVLVTAPVQEFLYHIRSTLTTKVLWIDAICISQKANDEKNVQLPLMTEIYSKASRVIVWLGPPDNLRETRNLQTLIRMLSWITVRKKSHVQHLLPDKALAFEALGQLFAHTWFERMWILQEVAAGDPVHVMHKGVCVQWESISQAAYALGADLELRATMNDHLYLNKRTNPVSKPKVAFTFDAASQPNCLWAMAEIIDNIRHHRQNNSHMTLAHLLQFTRFFRCGDPRDKVFALVNIATDKDEFMRFIPEKEPVDKDKPPSKLSYNDSVDEVYLNKMRYMLAQHTWFINLTMAGIGNQKIIRLSEAEPNKHESYSHRLPSWVVDLAVPTVSYRTTEPTWIHQREPGHHIRFTNDRRTIILQLHLIDEILVIGPHFLFKNALLDDAPVLSAGDEQDVEIEKKLLASRVALSHDWYFECRKLAAKHASSFGMSQEAAYQELWHLCISGSFGQHTPPPPRKIDPLSIQARLLFESLLTRDFSEIRQFAISELVELWAHLQHRFQRVVPGRAFAITKDGKFALVPELSKPGDHFVHVRGGYIPLLIRRTKTQECRAALVGMGSVHGIDEVYKGLDWVEWTLE